jgi:phospholipase A1
MKTAIRIMTAAGASVLLSLLFPVAICADELDQVHQLVRPSPGLSLHKEMFMLPITYSNGYNGRQMEAVFQVSAKHRLFQTHLYFAYTQISFWQAYDHDNSAPFRETNYNPEIFFRTSSSPLWSGRVGADIGVEHESNGQKPPISRSWNLVYVSSYYSNANVLLHLKLRYRVPEDDKKYPGDPLGDDNPDITDYLGYNDLNAFYSFWKGHTLHLKLRGNVSTGKGSVGLSYSFPVPKSDRSCLTFRVTHGYGESLVDYKRSLTRIGIGIMFVS